MNAVIGVYGTYDLITWWKHEILARPTDLALEKLLGTTTIKDRRLYIEASPIDYVIRRKNQISFF